MSERARDTPGKDRTYGAKAAPKDAPKRDLRKRGPKAALPKGSGLGSAVAKGFAAAGLQAGADIAGFGAAAVRGRKNVVAPGGRKNVSRNVGKALEPGRTTPGKVGRNFEVIGDDVLGKSLTNLLQGQPPKNAKDAAGLGLGIAGILPFGKGIKGVGATVKAARKAEETPVAGPKTLEDKVSIEIYNPHDGFNIYPNDPHPEGFSYSNAWVNADNPFEMIRTGWGAYLAPWEHSQFKPERRGRWVQATIVSENGYIERVNFGNVKARAPGADEKYMEKVALSALRGNPLRPQGPKTLNETVQDALPVARAGREEQEAGYSVVRGEVESRAMKAYDDAGGGIAGNAAFRQAMKGELPKVPYEGELRDLTPELLQIMYGRVRTAVDDGVLRGFEMQRAQKGIEKASNGITPQRSELDLIEKVFGKATTDSLADPANLARRSWLKKYGADIWNAPRSLQASADLSAPFRQGLVLGMRHPVIFKRNFAPMMKALRSDEYADAVMRELDGREYADLYDRAKLARTQANGASIGSREEMVPSALTDKIPYVRGSARAYTVFLNKMRADVFDLLIDHAKTIPGKDYENDKFLLGLGEYLNTATGRGSLGHKKLEDAADLLNSIFFSPRLLASRLQILNPNYYKRLYEADPMIALEAGKAAASTLGAISAFLYMGSLIPGVDVGLDPRSANFGKMRFRDTRVDVAAGFLPIINLASRIASRETVSSRTGEVKKLSGEFGESSPASVFQRFVETKFAPTPAAVWNVAKMRTFNNTPITAENAWKTILLPLLFPLNAQGAFETYKVDGSPALAGAAYGLGSIGFGVNTYPNADPKSKKAALKKSDKSKWKQPGSVLPSSSGTDKSGWKQP